MRMASAFLKCRWWERWPLLCQVILLCQKYQQCYCLEPLTIRGHRRVLHPSGSSSLLSSPAKPSLWFITNYIMDNFSLFTYILSYSRNEDPAETIPKNNVEPSADNSLMQQPCVIAWVKYIPFDPRTLTDGLLAYHTIYISFSDTFLSFLSEERIHLWNYDGFRNPFDCVLFGQYFVLLCVQILFRLSIKLWIPLFHD